MPNKNQEIIRIRTFTVSTVRIFLGYRYDKTLYDYERNSETFRKNTRKRFGGLKLARVNFGFIFGIIFFRGRIFRKREENIFNRNWSTIGVTIRVRYYNSVYHYICTYNTGCFTLIDPREYLLNYRLSEKVFQIKLTLFLEGYLARIANLV